MALFHKKIFQPLLVNFPKFSSFRNTDFILKQIEPSIQLTQKRLLFWEKDRKGGYETKIKVPTLEHIKLGFKELKYELDLLKEEIRQTIVTDPLLVARPG